MDHLSGRGPGSDRLRYEQNQPLRFQYPPALIQIQKTIPLVLSSIPSKPQNKTGLRNSSLSSFKNIFQKIQLQTSTYSTMINTTNTLAYLINPN